MKKAKKVRSTGMKKVNVTGMNKAEAKSAVKALYLQAASLAGFEVEAYSPERLVELVDLGFDKIDAKRRPNAVANLLKLLAEVLEIAQKKGDRKLSEGNVDAAKSKICPVYPFGK
jgi:hypothetical protein